MISHTALLAPGLLSKPMGCAHMHVCMSPGHCRACATAGCGATVGGAGQYGPAAQAGEDISPGGVKGKGALPTQSQKKGHLELFSVIK